jgi:hypothetical protein
VHGFQFSSSEPQRYVVSLVRKLFSFEGLRRYEHVFKHLDLVHEFVANLYNFAR